RAAALEELEAVILFVPQDKSEATRQAVDVLESMLDRDDQRPRVIELLDPIYEQAGDWQKRVELSRYKYAHADTIQEKVAVLRDKATLLEQHGGDMWAAFDAVKEAFV